MSKRLTKLQKAQKEANDSISKANEKINELGCYTGELANKLNEIQSLFDNIRNAPKEKQKEATRLKEVRLLWENHVERIEKEYKRANAKSAKSGVAGAGAGIAVTAMGPTAAMGIATTFGVASTGTAISSLSGAAATNAALAWLGGGAIAAGGGGMAAGNTLLALAGPIGWAIAGIAIIGSGIALISSKADKDRLENLFCLISERDMLTYKLAVAEIDIRISHIKHEMDTLTYAIEKIATFGLDYESMTETQQYELGSYVNLMNSSTQLLVNQISGLQPRYRDEDFDKFIYECNKPKDEMEKIRKAVVYIANLFFQVWIDVKDKKVLVNYFEKNKEFLKATGLKKKEFDESVIDTAYDAMQYKYKEICL